MVFYYDRSAVPVGEFIRLEVQFRDSAGNAKDPDTFPFVEILDGSSVSVIGPLSSAVARSGTGQYYYLFQIPDGYVSGIWNDIWSADVDGYSISDVFDFTVNSQGSIEAVGSSVPERVWTLDDEEITYEYTQEEIKGILLLRGLLKNRLQSTAYKPDGSSCPVFSNDLLLTFLCCALAELNATPAFTTYTFADNVIQTLAADLMTQGAMLVAWSSQAIIESSMELTVNDNGVTVNPPPVSSTISGMYNAQMSEYRAKLKEFKRNHRSGPIGMGAGSFLPVSPQWRRLRHRRELRII
jgi:hypothetical protein